jgi:hypothetical protein
MLLTMDKDNLVCRPPDPLSHQTGYLPPLYFGDGEEQKFSAKDCEANLKYSGLLFYFSSEIKGTIQRDFLPLTFSVMDSS